MSCFLKRLSFLTISLLLVPVFALAGEWVHFDHPKYNWGRTYPDAVKKNKVLRWYETPDTGLLVELDIPSTEASKIKEMSAKVKTVEQAESLKKDVYKIKPPETGVSK